VAGEFISYILIVSILYIHTHTHTNATKKKYIYSSFFGARKPRKWAVYDSDGNLIGTGRHRKHHHEAQKQALDQVK
jgi:hypothetical protein